MPSYVAVITIWLSSLQECGPFLSRRRTALTRAETGPPINRNILKLYIRKQGWAAFVFPLTQYEHVNVTLIKPTF